ncbi:MAG: polymer-forming cytoskeletal protein [Bdellovibrionales bacterium]|nr:polymer-forming cytoskeletal protein [Bdellovibrionales bacterium]
MWKKQDEAEPQVVRPSAATEPKPSTASASVIGSELVVKGELCGNEHLRVEGRVEGIIRLASHSVIVGSTGRIEGDVHADTIEVQGTVVGDLFGGTQVLVHRCGNVRGNITAPQVCLEQGAKLKGSVDMDPRPDGTSVSPWSEGKVSGDGDEDEDSGLHAPLNGASDAPQ